MTAARKTESKLLFHAQVLNTWQVLGYNEINHFCHA